MCSVYSVSRKSNRWPLKVFFREVDIAGINSYKIFGHNNSEIECSRKTYLKDLAFSLMKPHLHERATMWRLPKDIQGFLFKYRQNTPNVQTARSSQRQLCYICPTHKNSKTKVSCSTCQRLVCRSHSQHKVTCQNCQEEDYVDEDDY